MKQWLSTISNGFLQGWQQRRLRLGLYLFTLVTGLVLVLPVRSFLLRHAGHSERLDKLLAGLSYDFLNELRIAYGDGWLPDLSQLLLLTAIYLLAWTFFTGGIIQLLKGGKTDVNFWANCRAHFKPLLAINVIFWLLQLVLLGVFVLLYYQIARGFSPARLDSETIIFSSIPWVWGAYALSAQGLRIWQILSQAMCVDFTTASFYQAVGKGGRILWRHLGPLFGMNIVFSGMLILSYLIFHSSRQAIDREATAWVVGLLIVLTQLWLWVRIYLKLSFMAAVITLALRKH